MYGVSSHGRGRSAVLTPTRVDIVVRRRVLDVSLGEEAMGVIVASDTAEAKAAESELWMCGRLPMPGAGASVALPTVIWWQLAQVELGQAMTDAVMEYQVRSVRRISCGDGTFAALGGGGELFCWGWAPDWTGVCNQRPTPTYVKCVERYRPSPVLARVASFCLGAAPIS
eukprot:COSAG01_NODE_9067_length_2565_cov_1.320357_2_plen_170_part_00